MKQRQFKIGDWVEVLSKAEILATLDGDGRLDGIPFMPEMFDFCGRKFQVYKRAHKTCDPDLRSRRIESAVHLETRCNGRAHGGCQAGCLIYWKEAWLKPVGSGAPLPDKGPQAKLINIASGLDSAGGCSESVVWERVRPSGQAGGAGDVYSCQVTAVQYQAPLAWWDIRQYIEDYTSGNISLKRLLKGTVYSLYFNLSQAGIGVGPVMRWLHDKARFLWGGMEWPRKVGIIEIGQPTPADTLNLQPGELVRVKPYHEILRTVTTSNKNRGLWWDAELAPYCGGTYRVLARVSKVVDEKTGKMQTMKSPCIILDTVVCQARYSACRMFCPKATYAFWREIWLERVEAPVVVRGDVSTSSQPEIAEEEGSKLLYK